MPSTEDVFFQKLANASTEARTSDHLKLLGKRATGRWMDKEAKSLTDAVTDVVREEGGLNRDQIRRISETANQEAWKALFHEGGDSETSFPPADADTVIGEMSTKPEEVHDRGDMDDYSKDVPPQPLPDDIDLEEMFGVKDGTPEYEALNPHGEASAEAEKTAAALDFARFGTDNLVAELSVKGEELYELVKQAHLRDGYGILQISQAVGQAMEDQDFATETMQKIAERLAAQGIPFDQKVELEKVAQPLVINPEHELMTTAAKLEKVAKAYYSAEGAHKHLQTKHRESVRYLRDKLRGA
jgi:hypothetical protein